jgi:hypothetical protein
MTQLPSPRAGFLAAARIAVDLLARPELPDRWNEPSILPEFAVGDLAGHLARAILQVETFLDDGSPQTARPITASAYYADLVGVDDLHSLLNVGVRERGREVAQEGHAALLAHTAATLDRLTERLATEPATRQVTVLRGERILTLDSYLRTRLVELAVHIEDLELSLALHPGTHSPDGVERDTGAIDADATADALFGKVPDDVLLEAIEVLVGAALERHGPGAVLRALTRRERDTAQALRVL